MRAAGIRTITGTGGAYAQWTATLPIALAFSVLMLATLLAPRWAQSPVANRASRGLGDISYGIYLWHTLVIAFVVVTLNFDGNATTGAFVTLLAVTLAGSLALATLSLVLIERPCIRWARRTSRRIEQTGSQSGGDDPETVERSPRPTRGEPGLMA